MSTLDHLIVAGPDLPRLIAWLSATTGLNPVAGGRHPDHGTHNALVGLAGGIYLELMAPEPNGRAEGAYRRSIAHIASPELFTWCARTADLSGLAARAAALGLEVTTDGGSRPTAAGAELKWRLAAFSGHGLGGQVPFFIDWLDSPHPAAGLEQQASLTSLVLEHPDADGLTNLLDALGVDLATSRIAVRPAPRPLLDATLATATGSYGLSGPGASLRLG